MFWKKTEVTPDIVKAGEAIYTPGCVKGFLAISNDRKDEKSGRSFRFSYGIQDFIVISMWGPGVPGVLSVMTQEHVAASLVSRALADAVFDGTLRTSP